MNKKYESLVEKEKSLDMIIQLMDVFKNMGLDPDALANMGSMEDMEIPSVEGGDAEEELSPEDMDQFKTLLTALMGGEIPEGLFDFSEDEVSSEPQDEVSPEPQSSEPQGEVEPEAKPD